MFNGERWCAHVGSWCTGGVAEVVGGISYYPWCLKNSKGPRTKDDRVDYYTKIVGSGNLIVYSESVVIFYLDFWSKVSTIEIRISNLIVNCEWGEWSFGECSATCGGGMRTKIRKYIDECPGDQKINEECNIKPCPGTRFII